ncbi:probable RNA-binding protein 18 [Papaver somniferum]|uniref:probable RNA-binding protein 18 n=1 Tax=Papaver somniferum TaxID=3469 RepID=UPI000E7043B3|nr:probable RNA-binding protein 18 [Papaver somniferum]
MGFNGLADETSERRLYIGNLDQRITESVLIKMFSPYGKIESEEFLWHTRGPKRGEPRGFAFIQFSTKEEAQLAKQKMDGRLACGRPLVIRYASEKYYLEMSSTSPKASSVGIVSEAKKASQAGSSTHSGQMSRSAKIAAIKNKLKFLEEEDNCCLKKKSRQGDSVT